MRAAHPDTNHVISSEAHIDMASSLLHEELMYLWSQLRLEILKGLGNASSANPNAARLLEVVRAGSTSLGLVAGVEPCLWRSGMHPLLPRDAQLAADQAELLTLCELARCAGVGVGRARGCWCECVL